MAICVVCVREAAREKRYVEGKILVTRSPTSHPGDVQYARAIGAPPPDSPFIHEDFPDCIVFSCQGKLSNPRNVSRSLIILNITGDISLPHSLGGGDLDGDLYHVIQCESLFPPNTIKPAAYPPAKLKELPLGDRCTIDHVADFVVDFINNDHLGFISNTVGFLS